MRQRDGNQQDAGRGCQIENLSLEQTVEYREIIACRICGGGDLIDILDMGEHALSGRFPADDEPDAPSAPLRLILCGGKAPILTPVGI